jgi:hypothetical protein
MTMPGAIAALTPLVSPAATQPAPRSPAASRPVRIVAIDDDLARRIRHGLRLFVEAYNACQREAWAHAKVCPMHFDPAPSPQDELNAFGELVWGDILGLPGAPRKEGTP